ncbi:MAG: cystathionine beta-lyase [Methanobacteriales archaeon HGW-Methanobacteriales-1]|nr:MAG: cystathionine beta-lyase [Methanobacteriales archaeon HGW-Methanobacteriales-1]
MKYDFDQVCNRKDTDCLKWDLIDSVFGEDDIIPLWVADMDFPVSEEIKEALKERIEHPFYGYTRPGVGIVDAVVKRMKDKFDWDIEPEWVVFTPGVVPALHIAIRSLTHPGDEVLLQKPVYYPFFPAVTSSGCQIVNNGLKLIDGKYEIDFEDLEEKLLPHSGLGSNPNRIKTMIFCNPHNPVGRVWNREEITKLGKMAIDNGLVVISDEIHCEILFEDNKHTPFATISKEFEQNSIICMSPSKTFNLAGLDVSSIIIPNKEIRENFINTQNGMVPGPNLFGLTALEAAYRHGDEWLEQVMEYITQNLDFLVQYTENKIPKIKVIKPQGTYLIWLDCRELGLNDEKLKKFLLKEAKVGLNDGFIFGEEGSGFVRINIACPQTILEEALKRIENAVNRL